MAATLISTPSSCLEQDSIDSTICGTLTKLNEDFLIAVAGEPAALRSFMQSMSTFHEQLELSKDSLSDATLQKVFLLVDMVETITASMLELDTEADVFADDFSADLTKLLSGVNELSLDTISPTSDMSTELTLMPYIKSAYDWLLSNIHNPYPSKEVRSQIALSYNVSRKLVDGWFVDVRKRIGWNSLCKAHFATRKDMIDAATAFFHGSSVASTSTQPVKLSLSGTEQAFVFITLENRTKNLYSGSAVATCESDSERPNRGCKRSERCDDSRPAKRKRNRSRSAYPSPPASLQGSPEPATLSRESLQEPEDFVVPYAIPHYLPPSPASTVAESPSSPVTSHVTSQSSPLSSKRKRSSSCIDREETPISKRARRNVSAPVAQPTSVASLPVFDSWSTPVDVESFDFSIDTPPTVTVTPLAENVEWDTSSYDQFVAVLQRDQTPDLSEAGSSPCSAASPGLACSPFSELPLNLDYTTYQDASNQARLAVEPEPLIFDNNFNNTFYPDPFSTLLQPSVPYDMSLAPLNIMPESWLSPLDTDNLNAWSLPPADKGYSTFISQREFCQPAPIVQDEQTAKRLRAQQLREELRRLEQDIQS